MLDFGLAKLKEDARLMAEAGMPTAALTGDGRIVGTVAYMSPEQAEGKPVDQRSDVFSLGVMLYEMATGVTTVHGRHADVDPLGDHEGLAATVTEAKRGLPRDFSRIVTRCLSKDVEDRYQSAKDVRNDLRALKNDLTSGELVPVSAVGETVAWRPCVRCRAGFCSGGRRSGDRVCRGGSRPARPDTSRRSAAAARPFDSISPHAANNDGHGRHGCHFRRRPVCGACIGKGRTAEPVAAAGGDDEQRRDRAVGGSALRRADVFTGR